MQFETFFPWRLARMAEAVSHAMAQIYAGRFQLTRDEWRVLAAAAEAPEMETREVARRVAMDKVSMSRAASRLEDRGLITRRESPHDRRIKLIRLTPEGRAIQSEVGRIVGERAAYLMEGLAPAEREALDAAIGKLERRALVFDEPQNQGKCRPGCACQCESHYARALELAMAV
ncbi:MarR family winged helix-turn-helix transcriptional regulator [Oceanicella actignis]|uniref:DNA-binding transcriptional regulator, MarR family n=1 Tax=Oceanicella actignis TaxID=1189325 RepID=A0A1M7SSU7_9RHOB|nr:MarR family transcriptional regulator [Oceanicella actignis]TYO90727.1 DNA-binding MarR family transcriptional regulator [Oceanicella actignis]SES69407.1 DNA-binding transcriptional regulator, MarR family [Oceanicella actignis]SHN61595.1 DNA-binding transcriptional regulator, MarR family [Oceanicella actignis]